ncbi:fasciclin domain-containing protein [uncultured Chitinophaga sp.]|uniref:fasciclin domain-containing protein n=1 Tax=uncultured Chitinophaga sp. TaxID=339340 RepID=UPI0025F26862|nr:fasciclin domain-containing protein [uncultured Chitinophaga sp.]
MMNKKLTALFLPCLAAILLAVGCKKEEFQQLPHGEPVPYIDTVKHDLNILLAMSPYKLFYAAWQKSHVSEVMTANGGSYKYTVLAPDDAAMQAAGFTADAIGTKTAEELDSLVLFHVLEEQLDTLVLRKQKGNTRKKSLLYNRDLKEDLNTIGSNVTYPVDYNYKHYVSTAANGSLVVDGKTIGATKPFYATNGVIWPVNALPQRPTQHVLDLMATDPRFSVFSELYRQTFDLWLEASMASFPRTTFANLETVDGLVRTEAFFAPTNEAFRNAGFNSVADLMTLNERSMPYFDWDYFEMRNGMFVTDTLLSYHVWGRFYAPTGGWGPGATSFAVFFTNELTNELIGDFSVNTVTYDGLPAYKMPLLFGKTSSGQISVKAKGSTSPDAIITEGDIMTFEGPVHAVDHLLIPKDLRLN